MDRDVWIRQMPGHGSYSSFVLDPAEGHEGLATDTGVLVVECTDQGRHVVLIRPDRQNFYGSRAKRGLGVAHVWLERLDDFVVIQRVRGEPGQTLERPLCTPTFSLVRSATSGVTSIRLVPPRLFRMSAGFTPDRGADCP